MSDVIETILSASLVFSVCALALIAFFWAMAIILRQRRAFRSTSEALACGIFAVIAIIYGGSKPPTVTVTWDEHFSNKSYTVDTNDLRRISFAWSSPAWMPETARAILHAYGRAAGVPDAASVTNAPMSAGAMTAVMQHDATNYVYFVECDWSPEPTVVTNGVYHVRAVENDEKVVPIGVSIRLPEQQENQQ